VKFLHFNKKNLHGGHGGTEDKEGGKGVVGLSLFWATLQIYVFISIFIFTITNSYENKQNKRR